MKSILILKLQGLYEIEKETLKALPTMDTAATNPNLKEGFKKHLEETQLQVERLEKALSQLGQTPQPQNLQGIKGIIQDGAAIAEMSAAPEIKDTLLAGAARQVEHYEIASYLGAISVAEACGQDEIGNLLMKNLEEEMAADENLKMAAQEAMGMFAAK